MTRWTILPMCAMPAALLCVAVVCQGAPKVAVTTGTVKSAAARKAAAAKKPAPAEAITLGEGMFGKSAPSPSGSRRPVRRNPRANLGRYGAEAGTTATTVAVPASMLHMLQQQQAQQRPEKQPAQGPDRLMPSSRRAIPGSGAYRDVDGKMRVYDDGTQVDPEGNVRVFQGRTIPPGIKLDRVRKYMQSNSDATVEDAARAALEDNE